MNTPRAVYTIGHSTHSTADFIKLLKLHEVKLIIDVRSVPFSRWQPHFNQAQFAQSLEMEDIQYVFLGNELGARSQDMSCYVEGKVQYSRIAQTHEFNHGIERVISHNQVNRVALMCAEKEPLECHRTLLVAKALVAKSVDVVHIMPDGQLETNDHAMTRLLKMMKMPEQTLFETRDDLIEMACAKQESIIAYRSAEVNAA